MASSPPDGTVLSSSPISTRGISPVRRRGDRDSVTDSIDPSIRPRMSPTLARSFDPDDPDARERQRTMDVDMALHLSRARRETIVSPTSPFEPPGRSELEHAFAPLSVSEQHVMEYARGERPQEQEPINVMSDETLPTLRPPTPLHLGLPQLSPTPDPTLMTTVGDQYPPANQEDAANSLSGLPTYQANASRSVFDFTVLENFATAEKAHLGLISPGHAAFRLRQPRHPSRSGEPSSPLPDGPSPEVSVDSTSVPPRHGTRQRKISQSSPVPRPSRKGIRGKMALFENQPNEPAPGFPTRLMGNGNLSAVPSSENISAAGNQYVSPSLGGMGGIMSPGHDRPYRFSFYSNALSATIHARSLCELPAEGQSFEDLFSGVPSSGDVKGVPVPIAAPVPVPRVRSGLSLSSGRGTPNFNSGNQANIFLQRTGDKQSMDLGRPNGDEHGGDFEASTWWLDVQSPTDEEMKVLSKVFSIHPLTTEDIQMEEAREKIELFRNYYLVCFRSFDQDPYSPTHLEPLNMYIIVFREGILSFHFRPTPHPQNVRRRIKQLKDYINVTSDWISYALIDDITDAFGPLIQSIEYEVDSIDELVLILKEAEQSDMLRRIGTCRKKVMGLLRLMGNKADVVKGLAKRCNENWRVAPTSDIGLYLSDIQDHLITMTQSHNHYEKILSRSHSNYLAQISIEMTDANNQINDVLSKLTALGTILIPMNLITGLWGMNVHVPGQDITEGYTWFLSIIAVLATIALIGGYTTYKFMRR